MPLIKIVQNECDNNILAWKYPDDELNTLTQLIVKENEEAILFKDGQVFDIYQTGRYTLDTPNIPLLNRIVNLPFGCESPYKASVWFVNKIYTLDIKWGTRTPIQIQDPKYQILTSVRAFGEFGIRVENSKKFLLKLVGKITEFDVENIRSYFRGLYLTKVKDSISSYLVKKEISITEINAYLDELSEYVKERMQSIFEEYGIKLASFYINDISFPEDDEAIQKLRDALSKKAEMDIIGFDYQQERSFNSIDNYSKNSCSNGSGIANMGINLAAGLSLGKTIGQEAGKIVNHINTNGGKYCYNCGKKISENELFCCNCGVKALRTCPDCGIVVSDEHNYCPSCGRNLKERK